MKKIRLDQMVFDQGFTESRERAKTTIMSGIVFVNGQRALKPGTMYPEDAKIEVHGKDFPFVSRGGLKLDKAFKVFPISAKEKICIDCGAATGGFTDVLLRNGAKKVYAVDVGTGQLAWSLRCDPRVVNIENLNIRYISQEHVPELLDMAVMDASFISVKLLLPPVLKLLKDDADFVCLIKPQFEAGKEQVGKNGVVRDKEIHLEVINNILSAAPDFGLTVVGLDYSPIKGPKGNIEYLCYMKKGKHDVVMPDAAAVVEASHAAL